MNNKPRLKVFTTQNIPNGGMPSKANPRPDAPVKTNVTRINQPAQSSVAPPKPIVKLPIPNDTPKGTKLGVDSTEGPTTNRNSNNYHDSSNTTSREDAQSQIDLRPGGVVPINTVSKQQ